MSKMAYILTCLFFSYSTGNFAQTCCSGGVPLTGNLGMPSASTGSWQFSVSYDFNRLKTLREGTDKIDDNSRKRLTQSLLIESSYSFTGRLSLSGLFTYVSQSRTINGYTGENKDLVRGIGDAVVLITYRVGGSPQQRWELLLGAGPKIPLGSSELKNPVGILYNADLQPGSGAWDAVAWGLISKQGIIRPSTNLSFRFIFRKTGTNHEYQGSSTYRMGNELQLVSAISDQFLLGSVVLDPSLMFRFRNTAPDFTGGYSLPNTGGKWVYMVPGMVIHQTQNFSFRLAAEIPVYSNLQGIQLSTDIRMIAGIYFILGGKKSKQNFLVIN